MADSCRTNRDRAGLTCLVIAGAALFTENWVHVLLQPLSCKSAVAFHKKPRRTVNLAIHVVRRLKQDPFLVIDYLNCAKRAFDKIKSVTIGWVEDV